MISLINDVIQLLEKNLFNEAYDTFKMLISLHLKIKKIEYVQSKHNSMKLLSMVSQFTGPLLTDHQYAELRGLYINVAMLAMREGNHELAAQFHLALSTLPVRDDDGRRCDQINLLEALKQAVCGLDQEHKNNDLKIAIIDRITDLVDELYYQSIEPLFHVTLSIASSERRSAFKNIIADISQWGEQLIKIKQFYVVRKIYGLILNFVNDEYTMSDFSTFIQKYHELNLHQLNQCKLNYNPFWLNFRNMLLSSRERFFVKFENNPDAIVESQLQYTQDCNNLLFNILTACHLLLPVSDTLVAVLLMGSGSRGDMLPSSDIEPLVLIQQSDSLTINRVRSMLKILQVQLICVGLQLDAPYLLNESYQPLLNTPENLFAYMKELFQSGESGLRLFYSLLNTKLVFGSKKINEKFEQLRHQFSIEIENRKLIAELGISYNKKIFLNHIQDELTAEINIKERYIIPINMTLMSLSFYYQLFDSHPIRILENLKFLMPSNNFLSQLINDFLFLQVMRVNLSKNSKSISDQQFNRIKNIEKVLFKFFNNFLKKYLTFNNQPNEKEKPMNGRDNNSAFVKEEFTRLTRIAVSELVEKWNPSKTPVFFMGMHISDNVNHYKAFINDKITDLITFTAVEGGCLAEDALRNMANTFFKSFYADSANQKEDMHMPDNETLLSLEQLIDKLDQLTILFQHENNITEELYIHVYSECRSIALHIQAHFSKSDLGSEELRKFICKAVVRENALNVLLAEKIKEPILSIQQIVLFHLERQVSCVKLDVSLAMETLKQEVSKYSSGDDISFLNRYSHANRVHKAKLLKSLLTSLFKIQENQPNHIFRLDDFIQEIENCKLERDKEKYGIGQEEPILNRFNNQIEVLKDRIIQQKNLIEFILKNSDPICFLLRSKFEKLLYCNLLNEAQANSNTYELKECEKENEKYQNETETITTSELDEEEPFFSIPNPYARQFQFPSNDVNTDSVEKETTYIYKM